jgi:putative methyltransferase (TIGR04325 family)
VFLVKGLIIIVAKILKSILQTVAVFISRSKKINLPTHETSASFVGENTVLWSGDYKSWNDAKEITEGYDSAHILEKCKTSLLKVKNGEAVYERDSVLFDEIQYSWPLLAGLQRVTLESKGKLCVLDFGGSLGSTYYQNKDFLNTVDELQWSIVEQKNFVACGKEYFEDEQLKFYYTVEESILERKPNVLVLSSVLQYLEKPFEWIKKFIALKIPYIIIDRTTFVKSERDILTIQNVPEGIYKASYPAWFFNMDHFKGQFKNYTILASFDAHEGFVIHLENELTSTYKGFILKYHDR